MRHDRVGAVMAGDGAMNGDPFVAYVGQALAPTLSAGDVVILADWSAAIDMAYVAAGRFDGFWEVKLNPWDVSAGALLVEEAGGRVTGLTGGPFDSRKGEVVASNGVIHDAMVEIVRSRKRTN